MQNVDEYALFHMMRDIAREENITVFALETGFSKQGIDIGSSSIIPLQKPIIASIVGDGINSYEAGEVWHLLDHRYNIPLSQIDNYRFSHIDLNRYNIIIMVSGNYDDIETLRLKQWIEKGGTLIVLNKAVEWVSKSKIMPLSFKENDKFIDTSRAMSYVEFEREYGASHIGGVILESTIDITHPIGYGYKEYKLPIFKNNTLFVEKISNPYSMPVVYTKDPVLSGYVSERYSKNISNSLSVITRSIGKGYVIAFVDNPNFRAFWHGTNRLFMNAIFMGKTISHRTARW